MNIKTFYELLLYNYKVTLLAEFTVSSNFCVWIRIVVVLTKSAILGTSVATILKATESENRPTIQCLGMIDKERPTLL